MKNKILICCIFISLLLALSCSRKIEAPADSHVVHCAVIGGMTMTGLWQEIAKMFEAQTGYRVEVIATGPRPILDAAMRAGKVDLLTMHSGDITTDLVADGFGVNMRPWTRNELCILGPPDDPAHIRGMTNGAAALRKIAETKSRFVDFEGIGSRELVHTLWRLADAEPKGDWVLKDDTISKFNILQFARTNDAYVVVGYIPAQMGKMPAEGMEILVKGDPVMRRPFIVMEANPKKFPQANYIGARALSDFLLSDKVQKFLLEFGRQTNGPARSFFRSHSHKNNHHIYTMKFILTFLSSVLIVVSTHAAFFTNSPDADAFVRAAAPTSNYGAAGSLSVSGINATNASGVTNGAFDSFIRFNTTAMVANFNSTFGSNNWAVSGAKLLVTEAGAPAQTIFNRGKGAFEIRWIANTNWTEGTGMPSTPTTDGIAYTNETTLLDASTDASLGVFTNAGANGAISFQLELPSVFVSDLSAGGEVDFFLTAADPKIGFTMNSQNFGTASARSFLIISAVPRPGIFAISLSGTNVVLTATNGVAGGTYYVLSSTNVALPLNQWTPVATNVLTGNGNFTSTVTNANTTSQQFFIIQTQ